MLAGAVCFFPRQRRCLAASAAVLAGLSWGWSQYHRPEATVHVFDLGQDKATCLIKDDSSAYLWYNKSKWANPEQAVAVLTPALRYEGIFRLAGCIVSGYEPEHTKALIEANFILSESCKTVSAQKTWHSVTAGAVPYIIYEELPKTTLPGGACLELRGLAGGGSPFPTQAAALILYRSSGYDDAYTEWMEQAELYDIPWFSPYADGQITGVCREGMWTFFTYGGERS